MPELPEVETIKLQLQRYIIGHKIKDIDIRYSKCFSGDVDKAIGTRIIDINRFGKALSIDLDNGYSILIHVKMTGQLIYRGVNLTDANSLSQKVLGGLEGKHTSAVFILNKNSKLYFVDVRKFGWIKVTDNLKLKTQNDFVKNLGPEFLKDLAFEKFSRILEKSNQPIKILLMDQKKMAGVGNIYANEALFFAEIDPRKKSLSLSLSTRKKLFRAIETVLKEGIKRGGSSEERFVRPNGTEGEYQNFTLVYDKKDKPCKKCKTTIEKIKLGGRGTYFCPKCQK